MSAFGFFWTNDSQQEFLWALFGSPKGYTISDSSSRDLDTSPEAQWKNLNESKFDLHSKTKGK